MKTNLFSLIQITIASLCLTVTSSSQAQGNLLVNISWTVQYGFAGASVFINNSPTTGIFPVYFWQGGGSISQTISTTPEANYNLTFRAIQLDGITTSSVSVNGDLLANFTPDDPFISPLNNPLGQENTVWYNFDFSFTALSANTTISFTEQPGYYLDVTHDDPYWSNSALDSISVMAAPEPSSLALLGVGLFGLLACRRQRPIKTRKS